MWRELEPGFAGVGTGALEFDFPVELPPSWRHRWKDIVGHVDVASDEEAKVELLHRFTYGAGIRSLGFVNAHALNSCVTDPQFAADLRSLDILVRDGIGMKALYGLTGRVGGLNLNGTDLLPELFEMFRGRRIALFGTRLPIVQRVADQLRRTHQAEVVIADGFQTDGHYLDICDRAMPDLIVLGMGMPKQERVARLIKAGFHHDAAIVCGGAIFDFLSGHVVRAPLWMRRCGLEWAHRLSIEPKRLFGRYIIGNPLFLLRSLFMAVRPGRAHPAIRPQRDEGPLRPFIPRPDLRLAIPETEIEAGMRPDLPPRPVLAPPVALAAAVPALDAFAGTLAAQFAANRPVVAPDGLYGRHRELDQLVTSLQQHGSALVYAPRGYGKTSLVRVFGDIADALGHIVIYASCAKDADFAGLIQPYLDDVPGLAPAVMPPTVGSVAARLANVRDASIVFILDEFDRIARDDTRSHVIDLIKDTSDLGAPVSFLLVGVATDAEQVLGYHPSVHRCITCMPLGRLSDSAISDLLLDKSAADGLTMPSPVTRTILRVAMGSAYHAQLIGQKLVRRARDARHDAADYDDLLAVFAEILDDATRIDQAVGTLGATFADRRIAGHLSIFATMATADADDLVRISSAGPFAEAAAREAQRLESAGLLVRATSPGSADTCYRFANAFSPQLIAMLQSLAESAAAGSPDVDTA